MPKSDATEMLAQARDCEVKQASSRRLNQARVDEPGAVVADGVFLITEPPTKVSGSRRTVVFGHRSEEVEVFG